MLQSAESPASSQDSPAVRLNTPSPHNDGVQSVSHAAVSVCVPSSHSSLAAALMYSSPHTTNEQSKSQLIESPAVSQSSPTAWLASPSPHDTKVQLESQSTVSSPSSHSSPASASITPLPHSCRPTVRLSKYMYPNPGVPSWAPKWIDSIFSGADTPQNVPG